MKTINTMMWPVLGCCAMVSASVQALPQPQEPVGVPYIAAYDDWSAGISSTRVAGSHELVICNTHVGTIHYDFLVHAHWGGNRMDQLKIYTQDKLDKCIRFEANTEGLMALNRTLELPEARGMYSVPYAAWDKALTAAYSEYVRFVKKTPLAFATELYTADGKRVNLGDKSAMMAALDAKMMAAMLESMKRYIISDKTGTPNYKNYHGSSITLLKDEILHALLLDESTPTGCRMTRSLAYRHFAHLNIHNEYNKCGFAQIAHPHAAVFEATLSSQFPIMKKTAQSCKARSYQDGVLTFVFSGANSESGESITLGSTGFAYSVNCYLDTPQGSSGREAVCEFGDINGNTAMGPDGVPAYQNGSIITVYNDRIDGFTIDSPFAQNGQFFVKESIVEHAVLVHEQDHKAVNDSLPYLHTYSAYLNDAEAAEMQRKIDELKEASAMKAEVEALFNGIVADLAQKNIELSDAEQEKLREALNQHMKNNTAPVKRYEDLTYGSVYDTYSSLSHEEIRMQLVTLANTIQQDFLSFVKQYLERMEKFGYGSYRYTMRTEASNRHVCHACILNDTIGSCGMFWCPNYGKPCKHFKRQPGDVNGRACPIPTPLLHRK